MKRTVPLKDVMDFMTKEAKAARKEGLGLLAAHNETSRWDAFRMRHYAASVDAGPGHAARLLQRILNEPNSTNA